MDIEKDIRSLRICFFEQGKCEDCFYYDTTDFNSDCREKLIKDIIYKFEAESPNYKNEMPFCGECNYALSRRNNYCPKCGRKVAWDD